MNNDINIIRNIIKEELSKVLNEGIYVYHGSDVEFDKFDLDKIGSGDGKDLGGFGFYFSDSKDVAGRYITLKGKVKEYEIRSGKLFNLDDGLDSYVGEQIIDKLENMNIDENEIEEFKTDYMADEYIHSINNNQVYDWLSYVLGSSKDASEFLYDLGYIGNKFKDKVDTDAINYVVFNPNHITEV